MTFSTKSIKRSMSKPPMNQQSHTELGLPVAGNIIRYFHSSRTYKKRTKLIGKFGGEDVFDF